MGDRLLLPIPAVSEAACSPGLVVVIILFFLRAECHSLAWEEEAGEAEAFSAASPLYIMQGFRGPEAGAGSDRENGKCGLTS